jgi:hypothetical protein
MGTSQSTVVRVWKAHGLPRAKEAKSQLPSAAAPRTIRDVEGVYLTPQNKAVVLVAYDFGTPPPPPEPLPTAPPRRGTEPVAAPNPPRKTSNDLLRAVRLLYNANLLPSHSRHPHHEFLLFLRAVDHEAGENRDLFLLLESSDLGTDRSISTWLRHHPRFHLHLYNPNSRAGIRGPGWPKELVEPAPRPGVSENFPRLVRAFKLYSETYKRHPRPFVWTAGTPDLARLPTEAPAIESPVGVGSPEPSALVVAVPDAFRITSPVASIRSDGSPPPSVAAAPALPEPSGAHPPDGIAFPTEWASILQRTATASPEPDSSAAAAVEKGVILPAEPVNRGKGPVPPNPATTP